jgi:hypothetical protein
MNVVLCGITYIHTYTVHSMDPTLVKVTVGYVISHTATEVHKKNEQTNKKKTPWPLVRERTIPTDRPPLVDEI